MFGSECNKRRTELSRDWDLVVRLQTPFRRPTSESAESAESVETRVANLKHKGVTTVVFG